MDIFIHNFMDLVQKLLTRIIGIGRELLLF